MTADDLKAEIKAGIADSNIGRVRELINIFFQKYRSFADDEIWFAKGLCHHQDLDFEEAVEAYTECININSKHTWALTNRAICLIELNEPGYAFEDFQTALKIDQNIAPAWYNIGTYYTDRFWASEPETPARKNAGEKSISAFRKMVQVDEKFGEMYLSIPLLGLVSINEYIEMNKDEPERSFDEIMDWTGIGL